MIKRFLVSLSLAFLIIAAISAPAMSSVRLEYPKFHATDSTGAPLSGGKLYTYETGSNTGKYAYSDRECTTPLTNPIVLDSNGEASIYLLGSYKLVLKDADGVTIWTVDNVEGSEEAYLGQYYPVYDAADQGAEGDGYTIKHYIDDIGSTNKGTIYLRHNSGGEFTDYEFSTSITIPSNIRIIVENGARIVQGGAATITINSDLDAGSNQIFYDFGAGEIIPHAGSLMKVSWFGDLATAISNLGGNKVRLIQDRSETMSANVTIPATLTYEVSDGAMITAAGSWIFTLNGPMIASRHQVFTGFSSGNLILDATGTTIVYPEWFGAVGDGSTADTAAFTFLTETIIASGGNIKVLGNPSSNYLIESDQTITVSNVTFDWQWATLTGYHRFLFDGDSGTDGDWSDALYNVHFKNAYIGTVNDATCTGRGPAFWFCIDSSAENIIKKGFSGTSFNVHMSKRVTLKNITNYGGKTTSSAIGFLVHMSDDCIIENCHVRDGAFVYCFQVKGGRNNVVRDCSVDNVDDAGAVTCENGFRDRGDSPHEASTTTGTYPFNTLGWSDVDPRRASINTRYVNCRVENSTVCAFAAQEATGTTWENCSYYNVSSGWFCYRANDADSVEKDFTIINPVGDLTTSGYGIDIAGTTSYHLANTKVLGGTITRSHTSGLYTEYADDVLVDGLTTANNGQENSGTYYGMTATAYSYRPKFLNCRSYDDQASATQDYGLYVSTTCTDPTVQNFTGSGNISKDLYCWLPGTYINSNPADAAFQTTSGSALDSGWRCTLNTNDLVWIELTIIADVTDHSHRAVYKIGGLFYNAAGTVTQQGSTAALITAIESSSGWDAAFTTSGNAVRLSVTGAAATTINWRVHASIKRLM